MYPNKIIGSGFSGAAASGGLAATGFPVALYAFLALGLVVTGALLLRAANFRRGTN